MFRLIGKRAVRAASLNLCGDVPTDRRPANSGGSRGRHLSDAHRVPVYPGWRRITAIGAGISQMPRLGASPLLPGLAVEWLSWVPRLPAASGWAAPCVGTLPDLLPARTSR